VDWMPGYEIRKADINDLQEIYALWRKLSYDQLSKDQYYEGDFDFEGNEGELKTALTSKDCAIFVAMVDGVICGYSEVWLYHKDLHFFIDDYAYVLHFYVDVAARKQRVIWSLVHGLYQACEVWAVSQGRKYIIADAFYHNQRIMRIMERFGMTLYRSRFVKPLRQE
jgi:GNAT superfamily N-acetyltransferase